MRVQRFATPWIAARQASLSITNSRSSLRLTSIESVMPSRMPIMVLVVKNPPANARHTHTLGSPWRKAWQPTLVFLPGEAHGQRSLAGYSPWDHQELDTTDVMQHHVPRTVLINREHQYHPSQCGGKRSIPCLFLKFSQVYTQLYWTEGKKGHPNPIFCNTPDITEIECLHSATLFPQMERISPWNFNSWSLENKTEPLPNSWAKSTGHSS